MVIGAAAFSGCAFASLYVPDSVTYVGMEAFSYNKNLTSASVPSGARAGGEVFLECPNVVLTVR